jgi:hypothetical protein
MLGPGVVVRLMPWQQQLLSDWRLLGLRLRLQMRLLLLHALLMVVGRA